MGHLGLRKILKKETLYNDKKKIIKHKCEFNVHCVLKVNLINDKIQYYNVMKCNKCLSFISIKEPGNIQGCIFDNISKEQEALPLITASSKEKTVIINFADLEDVSCENRI